MMHCRNYVNKSICVECVDTSHCVSSSPVHEHPERLNFISENVDPGRPKCEKKQKNNAYLDNRRVGSYLVPHSTQTDVIM